MFPVHSLFPKKMHPLPHSDQKITESKTLEKQKKRQHSSQVMHFFFIFLCSCFLFFFLQRTTNATFIYFKKPNLLEVSFKTCWADTSSFGLKSQERVWITACHMLADLGVPQFPRLCNGVTTITAAWGCNGVPFSYYWKGFIPMPGTGTCLIYIYY